MSGVEDLITEYVGPRCEVRMLKRVKKEFDRIGTPERNKLAVVLHHLAHNDPKDLPESRFKFEGRFRLGDSKGREIGVFAVKANQKRIYGAFIPLRGRNTFICSEIDVSKKQNRADQDCLRRAATNIREFVDG